MQKRPLTSLRSFPRFLGPTACTPVLAALLAMGAALAPAAARADAADLKAQYQKLQPALRNNDFQRALHIASNESGGVLTGDVYAVLDYPFDTVRRGLAEPAGWCDVLVLPFNSQYCRPAESAGQPGLDVRIGRKPENPIDQAYKLQFSWDRAAATADYLETRLSAPSGPLGTRDYRIAVSATPLDGQRSFMHLRYSYATGTMGRLAMQAYLATAGADKIGFTVTGRDAQGQPAYTGGARGAIERNAMRYYLAIDATLQALAAPAAGRDDRRARLWFAATERYPQQLHEMDEPTYLALKREVYERQRNPLP